MSGEGNGTPLQYSCLENPMDGGAWEAVVHGVAKSQTRPSDFTFTFHFHALEKEMATHSFLENPRDGGAWWAAVYGVAQSRAQLKRLSSSSSSSRVHVLPPWGLTLLFGSSASQILPACARPSPRWLQGLEEESGGGALPPRCHAPELRGPLPRFVGKNPSSGRGTVLGPEGAQGPCLLRVCSLPRRLERSGKQ